MTRKEAILEAASQLFAAKGFNETSTAEVAAAAGVAQGTVFYHFHTKEEMLLQVFERLMAEYLAGLEPASCGAATGLEGIEAAIRFHFQFARKKCGEIQVLLRDFPHHMADLPCPERALMLNRITRVVELFVRTIDRGKADGSIRTDIVSLETAYILRGLLVGLTRQKLLGPLELPELESPVLIFCRHAMAC
ncbi:MAG: TetR/AcrR family transcriptional regulator [Desulfuromonadales bacterium]|nr:TetR/AcrR family transcriptional regulator [Desulfuromonadales bacterium]MDT8445078.1 TetR/AcrR family transcriptional regulator [Desulfuromonadales bacterium]